MEWLELNPRRRSPPVRRWPESYIALDGPVRTTPMNADRPLHNPGRLNPDPNTLSIMLTSRLTLALRAPSGRRHFTLS